MVGSKGKITFLTFGIDPIVLKTASGTEEWNFEQPKHVHQPLVETIVAELTGDLGKCPSTGVTGKRINWVMGDG